jgi:Tfp pilus assembly protein PilX
MKRPQSARRGAALLFALLTVLVVGAVAVVFQTRSEETLRRRRTDRAVTLARLRAESAVATIRAALARGADPASLPGTDPDGTATTVALAADGTLLVSAIGVVPGPSAASSRLDVTLRPVPGRLPEIVAWREPGASPPSE